MSGLSEYSQCKSVSILEGGTSPDTPCSLSLARQTGSDPALVGLLRVFKNYYPEIIVGEVTKGRAAAFKHPDLQWRARLDEVRNQHMEHREDGIRNGFAVNHVLAGKLNRSKLSVIPHVHTPHSHEVRLATPPAWPLKLTKPRTRLLSRR